MTVETDHEDQPEQVDRVIAAAQAAAAELADLPATVRAAALGALADALDREIDDLVALADAETGLGVERLRGEVGRTTTQLRMFADLLADPAYPPVTVDAGGPADPELRRSLFPLGPVLVFAASNFPFAFSVAGGDTASALAAGCPVVLKAHPGHPVTSARTAALVTESLTASGLPAGTFAMIQGTQAGVQALRHPAIAAGAFTGSTAGGRALMDIAAARPNPIPFYAEMGSLNPTFVSPGALAARGAEIAEGYVASFTLGAGQFCTKPGLLFLPRGHALTASIVEHLAAIPVRRLLTERIQDLHGESTARLRALPAVTTLHVADASAEAPTLLSTTVSDLLDGDSSLLEECFGPTSVLVEYDDVDELAQAALAVPGGLTATVHGEVHEAELLAPLLRVLRDRAGRLVWNGWPTGVRVSPAMHHGGPYPAGSSALHTSVGTAAIDRFLRPLAFQGFPDALLPAWMR